MMGIFINLENNILISGVCLLLNQTKHGSFLRIMNFSVKIAEYVRPAIISIAFFSLKVVFDLFCVLFLCFDFPFILCKYKFMQEKSNKK